MDAIPRKPKVVVRIATPQDINLIEKDPYWGNYFRDMVQKTGTRITAIAIFNGKIAGCCIADINDKFPNKAKIQGIEIEPNFRDASTGHKLLGRIHERMIKKGVVEISVNPCPWVRKFFEKAGYNYKQKRGKFAIRKQKAVPFLYRKLAHTRRPPLPIIRK